MDLRQLECFVAVAEELHFRRAGERLGLSQSALSERISGLEHAVGVPLLFRTTRQVSLTQAGSEFLKDALRILEDVDKSVAKIQQTSANKLKSIRISGVDEAISMLLPPAITNFRHDYPNIHIQILEISSSDRHLQELTSHRTDIAFIRSPVDDPFVTCDLLYDQPVVVALTENHPLAKAESLSPADIKDQLIVGYPKHARPILHDMLYRGFRELNIRPNVVCEVIDKSTLLQFVAHGLGIGLVPSWTRNISPPGLSFVPFSGENSQVQLFIAHRTGTSSSTVDVFLNHAKNAAKHFHDSLSESRTSKRLR